MICKIITQINLLYVLHTHTHTRARARTHVGLMDLNNRIKTLYLLVKGDAFLKVSNSILFETILNRFYFDTAIYRQHASITLFPFIK